MNKTKSFLFHRIKLRILCCGLFVLLLGVSNLGFGQNITISADNETISEVLDKLTAKYNIYFSHEHGTIENRVSITAQDEDIKKFLNRLLRPYGYKAVKNSENFYFVKSTSDTHWIQIVSETGEPVSYALLQWVNAVGGAYANEDGWATVILKDPNDQLEISSVGYKTQRVFLNYEEEKHKVTLVREFTTLLEAEIVEYLNRGITLRGDISETTIFPGKMDILPGLSEPDVLFTLQMLPGVSSNDESAANINIRGGNRDQGLVYWENVPVYHTAHYFGMITSFIPGTVERMSIHKNYVPSDFSGATSGLIRISLGDSMPERWSLTSNSNFTHSDLVLKAPLGDNSALILAARRSFNHLWESPSFNSYSDKLFEGKREEVGVDSEEEELNIDSELKFTDVNAKYLVRLDNRDELSMSLIIIDDQLNFQSNNSAEQARVTQEHQVSFRGAGMKYKKYWSEKWSTELSMAASFYDLNNAAGLNVTDIDPVRDSLNITNATRNNELRLTTIRQKKGRGQFRFGYQLNQFSTSLGYAESSLHEPEWKDTLDEHEMVHGLFVAGERKWGNSLIIRPQIRSDFYQESEQFVVNPILNLQYSPVKGMWLKASYGHYSQALRSINELQINASNVSEYAWLLADGDDLQILRSRQGTFGFLIKDKTWLIDMDVYSRNTTGISAINHLTEDVAEDLDFASGEANSIGLDLLIRKKMGPYRAWLSYSLSRNTNSFAEFQGPEFRAANDRPHQLSFNNNYHWKDFNFALAFQLKSGAPYTEAESLVYDAIEDEYTIKFKPINSSRLPIYHRLDMSVWYRLPFKSDAWKGMLGLSFVNLYDRDNVWRRFYFVDEDDQGQAEIIEEERFFLGFTPNLSLRLTLQ